MKVNDKPRGGSIPLRTVGYGDPFMAFGDLYVKTNPGVHVQKPYCFGVRFADGTLTQFDRDLEVVVVDAEVTVL